MKSALVENAWGKPQVLPMCVTVFRIPGWYIAFWEAGIFVSKICPFSARPFKVLDPTYENATGSPAIARLITLSWHVPQGTASRVTVTPGLSSMYLSAIST
jgi:hypothetical protein